MEGVTGPKAVLIRGLVRGMVSGFRRVPEAAVVKLAHNVLGKTCSDEAELWLRRSLDVARKVFPRLNETYRRKIVDNFVSNAMILGTMTRAVIEREEGVHIPFFFVISPTMACNLRCYGCYAGMYHQNQGLDTATLDRIFTEAKELGIYFITVSGGEPYIRPDLLDLFEKHHDMFFQTYTNGTLIDPARLSKLGNVFPAISVEGFERETDTRRGRGTYARIMEVMDGLREEGCAFGFSCTATSQNVDLVSSDEFVDFYREKGCLLGWYFTYIPIGRKPNVTLMPTPEQRHHLRRRVREMRDSHDIILGDFWNDGLLTGGCIAGGRYYFHINANGDVEPCVFVHFAVDNIKQKSLKDVLAADFFKIIRSKQPYDRNLLRPCMIIDAPHILRKVVAETGAHTTHEGAETLITDLKEFLDRYAEEYGELADQALVEEYHPTSGKAREAWEKVMAERSAPVAH